MQDFYTPSRKISRLIHQTYLKVSCDSCIWWTRNKWLSNIVNNMFVIFCVMNDAVLHDILTREQLLRAFRWLYFSGWKQMPNCRGEWCVDPTWKRISFCKGNKTLLIQLKTIIMISLPSLKTLIPRNSSSGDYAQRGKVFPLAFFTHSKSDVSSLSGLKRGVKRTHLLFSYVCHSHRHEHNNFNFPLGHGNSKQWPKKLFQLSWQFD